MKESFLKKHPVIYDRIDSGHYYKTMIPIESYTPHLTSALSSIINYDRKWRYNLVGAWLTDDRKTFIVQATGFITEKPQNK